MEVFSKKTGFEWYLAEKGCKNSKNQQSYNE